MKTLLIKFMLIVKFILVVLWEIIVANLRVAHDVITPQFHARPGVISIPLDCKKDIEITLLAIVISLTPGTIVLDLSSDKKHLYIHTMFLMDREKLTRNIKNTFEMPIMRILEWSN